MDSTQRNRNVRVGLVLFVIYATIYAAFVLTNALAPTALDATPWLGIQLSVWLGFGLIVLAFACSLLYGWLCRQRSPHSAVVREQKS